MISADAREGGGEEGAQIHRPVFHGHFNFKSPGGGGGTVNARASQCASTWVAVHGGEVVLVVLVWGQLPGADRGVEGVRVGDEVGVSQVGGQVVCRGEGRRVGGRVALRRLGGDHHPADPCVVLQHLGKDRRAGGFTGEVVEGAVVAVRERVDASLVLSSSHTQIKIPFFFFCMSERKMFLGV